jgi:hypothetical protein
MGRPRPARRPDGLCPCRVAAGRSPGPSRHAAWMLPPPPPRVAFGSMSDYRMKDGEDLWQDVRQGLQG